MKNSLAAGLRNIVVDLERLSFMDSSGAEELISSLNAVRKHGGELKLLRPAERIERLLHISRLETVFPIYDDETEAIASYSPGAGVEAE